MKVQIVRHQMGQFSREKGLFSGFLNEISSDTGQSIPAWKPKDRILGLYKSQTLVCWQSKSFGLVSYDSGRLDWEKTVSMNCHQAKQKEHQKIRKRIVWFMFLSKSFRTEPLFYLRTAWPSYRNLHCFSRFFVQSTMHRIVYKMKALSISQSIFSNSGGWKPLKCQHWSSMTAGEPLGYR